MLFYCFLHKPALTLCASRRRPRSDETQALGGAWSTFQAQRSAKARLPACLPASPRL